MVICTCIEVTLKERGDMTNDAPRTTPERSNMPSMRDHISGNPTVDELVDDLEQRRKESPEK